MRCLASDEIGEISKRINFAHAARETMSTADVKPIDMAIGQAQKAAREAVAAMGQAWPSFEFSGALEHPPVPLSMRKYVKEEKWNGYEQPTRYEVRGVKADGHVVLFFSGGVDGRRKAELVWGVDLERNRLVFHRELDLGAIMEIGAPEGLARAIAELAKREIGEASASPSTQAPRLGRI